MLERKSGSPNLVAHSSSDSNVVNPGSDGLSHDEGQYFLYPKPPVVGRRRTSMTGKASPGFSDQFDGGDPHSFRRRLLDRRGSAPEVTIGLPPIEDRSRKMSVLSKSSSKLSLEKLNTTLADVTSSSMSHVIRKGGVSQVNGDRNDCVEEPVTLGGTRDCGSCAKPQVLKEKSDTGQRLSNSHPNTNFLRPYTRRRRLSSSPTNLQRDLDRLNSDLALSSKKYSNIYGKERPKDKNKNILSKDKPKGNKSIEVEDDDDDHSVDEEFNQRILTWIDDVQKATRNPFLLSDDEDDGVSRETAIRIIHTGE